MAIARLLAAHSLLVTLHSGGCNECDPVVTITLAHEWDRRSLRGVQVRVSLVLRRVVSGATYPDPDNIDVLAAALSVTMLQVTQATTDAAYRCCA